MTQTLSQLPPVLLVVAYALFWGWEALAAARSPRRTPHRRWRNLTLTVFSIAIAAISGGALMTLAQAGDARGWGLLRVLPIAPWAAVVAGLLALDAVDYWRHRLSHVVPALWRLHRVHHTDPEIDVTTTFRNHPLEMLLRPAFLAAGVLAFGVPPVALLLQPVLSLPVLVFQHANIRLHPALDRALAGLIVTPGMHLVHHSRERSETDSNYGTWLSLWDTLFGSRRPSRRPAALGVEGFDAPQRQSLVGVLASPFV